MFTGLVDHCNAADALARPGDDPALASTLASVSTTAALRIDRGVEAIGALLADGNRRRSKADEVTFTSESMEALALLIAEVVNLSAALTGFSRRGPADYSDDGSDVHDTDHRRRAS